MNQQLKDASVDQYHQHSQVSCQKFLPTAKNSHNFVPFLSKSNRFYDSTKNLNPAIGTYDIPSCFNKKKEPFQDKIGHFLLQAQHKKNQMSIFKSQNSRFENIRNTTPSPSQYNIFKKISLKNSQKRSKKTHQKQNIAQLNKKTYPSIPNSKHKYGYVVTEGKMMEYITKNSEELQKQKESRNQYSSTLNGQHYMTKQSFCRQKNSCDYKMQLSKNIQKLLTKNSGVSKSTQSNFYEKKNQLLKVNKKPKFDHLYHSKPQESRVRNLNLGPGQYDIKSNFEKLDENQKFRYQFFGSSEVRFRQRQPSVLAQKQYTFLQMIKDNRKADLIIKPKRTHKESPKHSKNSNEIKDIYPGPGEYQPKDTIAKKTRGTAIFAHQQRFKKEKQEKIIRNPSQLLTSDIKWSHFTQKSADKYTKFQKQHNRSKNTLLKTKTIEKLNMLNEAQDIRSWTRGQKRNIYPTKKGVDPAIQTPQIESILV